jgi:hypothetical protein
LCVTFGSVDPGDSVGVGVEQVKLHPAMPPSATAAAKPFKIATGSFMD